jgi:hypothetical protein
MIRSENDRGLAIILDRRAPSFAGVLPGLEPIGDLAHLSREFYGRRARWTSSRERTVEETIDLGGRRSAPEPDAEPTEADEPRL